MLFLKFLTSSIIFFSVFISIYKASFLAPLQNLSRSKIPIIPAGLRPIFRFAILASLANCSRALGHATPPDLRPPFSATIPLSLKQCVKIERGRKSEKLWLKILFASCHFQVFHGLPPLSLFSFWPCLLFQLSLLLSSK